MAEAATAWAAGDDADTDADGHGQDGGADATAAAAAGADASDAPPLVVAHRRRRRRCWPLIASVDVMLARRLASSPGSAFTRPSMHSHTAVCCGHGHIHSRRGLSRAAGCGHEGLL